jgi:hypothetical protein
VTALAMEPRPLPTEPLAHSFTASPGCDVADASEGVPIGSSASCLGVKALFVRSLAELGGAWRWVWPWIDLEPRHISPMAHPFGAPAPLGLDFPSRLIAGVPSINKPVLNVIEGNRVAMETV